MADVLMVDILAEDILIPENHLTDVLTTQNEISIQGVDEAEGAPKMPRKMVTARRKLGVIGRGPKPTPYACAEREPRESSTNANRTAASAFPSIYPDYYDGQYVILFYTNGAND
jgi:hypothetical protein